MKRIAVVPGSFDPVTAGHVDIIARTANIFDEVFTVVMDNPDKRYLFTFDKRLELLRDAVKDFCNVTAEYSSGFLHQYARGKNACAIVKGVRSSADYEYEKEMAEYNRLYFPEAETLLLFASDRLSGVSSSFVREKARRGECLDGLVPDACKLALTEIFTSK